MQTDALHFTNTLVARHEFCPSISPWVSFTYVEPFQLFQKLQHPISLCAVEPEYLRWILILRVSSSYLSKADEQELIICHVKAR